MKTAYLSLGANLGDRERNLEAALEKLAAPDLRIRRVSSVYETAPVDTDDPRWFLNLVVEAHTDLFPMQLLWRIGKIEHSLGRVRTVVNGPRTIDIDILLYGRAVIHSLGLEVPHPRMMQRRFVLAPLAELAPDLRHPVARKTIRELLDRAPEQSVRRLAKPIACGY
ncbi:MAG TPA: 2-amino-4-hydroxy-6-hydroxymethyldihydropteridine diphosphokinase [Bryobacteraceae bacterium]|nr:2-amino-4-hydroxy-6-hydroxymethyldihydropteridine diphosphokinase [Bryobacteraceae bacterium]